MRQKIVAKGLHKIFGRSPDIAMEMLRKRRHKDEIFKETGMVVGVQDATFAVNEGEIFVIMGLSGSGKSTLIRLLNRLIEPTAGQILVDGQDVATMSKAQLVALRRRDMAMVFQSFALLPHLTVLDNAAFGLEVAGMGRKERERRALEVLDEVGLKAFAGKRPAELSGGMQQRVGLARALAVDPSLMLMDEAFSALDPLKRTEMQELLLTLQKEHKRTIIFVSHDLDEAFRIGNRIAIMEGGRVVQIGSPDEILRNPADDYVRAFFKGVDVKRYLTAKDVALPDEVLVMEAPADLNAGFESAIGRLRQMRRNYGFVVDKERRVLGTVSIDSMLRCLAEGRTTLEQALLDDIPPVPGDTRMTELISNIVRNPYPLPIIDGERRYLGAVTQTILLRNMAQETANV
ncbi:glycine betaine/L-proline ABC transporter ATP-binding protein ProV [Aromatoleum petrolei]|uniref:Quaternary amine transport ATP-binding protein n=1 Tax=Aromatoleum petrolei TaxID=76116 RepID=A0ABX1MHB0_9RHOO|nr:glycine betaine/L-proline ABC transporter ATP-binding protein ProV [Aromatoleum petrolei]NMF87337.1 glycine betaine/L-proline ABC transporter ATP-binding protein ProV [Aromatoleum petrolei]QTQ38585.1 Glycine/betaine ABC transporter, ATP-binding protein [Aromatoleum petrolei]